MALVFTGTGMERLPARQMTPYPGLQAWFPAGQRIPGSWFRRGRTYHNQRVFKTLDVYLQDWHFTWKGGSPGIVQVGRETFRADLETIPLRPPAAGMLPPPVGQVRKATRPLVSEDGYRWLEMDSFSAPIQPVAESGEAEPNMYVAARLHNNGGYLQTLVDGTIRSTVAAAEKFRVMDLKTLAVRADCLGHEVGRITQVAQTILIDSLDAVVGRFRWTGLSKPARRLLQSSIRRIPVCR
ncbi:MAG: hypothetical protein RLY31_2596 [Bacteroidota bacterium]